MQTYPNPGCDSVALPAEAVEAVLAAEMIHIVRKTDTTDRYSIPYCPNVPEPRLRLRHPAGGGSRSGAGGGGDGCGERVGRRGAVEADAPDL